MPSDHTPVLAGVVDDIDGCRVVDGGHVLITQCETIDASRAATDVRRAISEHASIHHSDQTISWCADVILQCQMNTRQADKHIQNLTRESFHVIRTRVLKALDNMAQDASTLDACHYSIIRNAILTAKHEHVDFKERIQELAVHKCHEMMSTQ